MFPVTTKAGGSGIALPDTCNTPAPPAPPVPVPYPCNVSMAMANPSTCSLKVKVSGAAVLTLASVVTTTSGDEAGSMGGLVSGMTKGPARFTQGSAVVVIEGSPVAFQTCPLDANGNNANAKGIHAEPSQLKVLVAS